MATLSLTIVSTLGTNATTLTFSAADAGRIFTAWKNSAGPKDASGVPNGTQAQFTAYLAQQLQNQLATFVTRNETLPVISPVMTAQTT